MVRIVSFCVWLGTCALSPLAGAQASSVQSGAPSPVGPARAAACTVNVSSPCALWGAQPGQCAAPAPPVQAPGAQCEGLPLATYSSPWASYRPWRDDAVGDWRRANAEVARIGGWRVYARETAPPAQTPTAIKELP